MKRSAQVILTLALVGCVAQQQQSSSSPVSTTSEYNLRASQWSTIVQMAAGQAEFVGVDRTEDTLFIGYSRNPEANLAMLTNRNDVKAFLAPRSRADLDAALIAARQMVTELGVPFVGLSPEYRTGSIIVSDIENAAKSGTYFCDQLVKVPKSIGPVGVGLIDRRSCASR